MTDTEAQKGDAAEEPKTRPPVVQHVSVRSGSVVTGRVESLSAEGRGVFRVGARKVHVRGAWPGDEIEAYVYRRRRGVAEARIERVLEEAIPRREPPCSHIGECGGCIWQQWPVADQLGMKRRLVEKALTEELPGRGVVVDPVRTAGPEFGYRNKMEFSFDQFKESPVKVGLHHAGRYNAVLDVDRCWIAPSRSERDSGYGAYVGQRGAVDRLQQQARRGASALPGRAQLGANGRDHAQPCG